MMGSFTLDKPEVLFGFVALLVYIVVRIIGDRKYRNILVLFAGKSLWFRYRCSRFLFWLFLACLIIALAGPRWGSRSVTEYRRGLDAVLALDVSRSMEVRDIPGISLSRLEQALAISRDLAEGSAGIRLGAAVSRGRGILAVPLTDDAEAITSFLGGLSGSALSGRGTNLEALVDAAASAFLNSFPTRRVIILISDGESLSGSLSDAIDRAIAEDITFVVLGTGTEEGGPVPASNGLRGSGGSSRGTPADLRGGGMDGSTGSRDGSESSSEEPIISYRRSPILKNAAERGRGLYIDGNRGDAAAVLTDYLQSLAAESGASGSHREGKPRWIFFVILALISLGSSKRCMLESRWKKAKP
jgi:Ca-activated chloride channel family protein